MKNLIGVIPVLILLLALSGCATISEPTTEYHKNADISGFQAYSWASNLPQISGEINPDVKYDIDLRMRTSVDRDLASKGYVQTAGGQDAFVVNYRMNIHRMMKDLPTGAIEYTSYDEKISGTITIEIADPDTRELLWSGSVDTGVYGYSLFSTKTMAIENAVRDILADIPDSR